MIFSLVVNGLSFNGLSGNGLLSIIGFDNNCLDPPSGIVGKGLGRRGLPRALRLICSLSIIPIEGGANVDGNSIFLPFVDSDSIGNAPPFNDPPTGSFPLFIFFF